MQKDPQGVHAKEGPVPTWAAKYQLSDNAACCIDQFACRGRPSIAILNVDDIERLNRLHSVLKAEGKSISGPVLVKILTDEYQFVAEHAEYIAKFYEKKMANKR